MVLVDTSVWVAHFRQTVPALTTLLEQDSVLVHPFVVGELACGNLRNRREVLDNLLSLTPAIRATDAEVLDLLERQTLWGIGVGWVDVHLIASALLTNCQLWTHDGRLANAADRCGVTTAAK